MMPKFLNEYLNINIHILFENIIYVIFLINKLMNAGIRDFMYFQFLHIRLC
jgi:hypothetical protein